MQTRKQKRLLLVPTTTQPTPIICMPLHHHFQQGLEDHQTLPMNHLLPTTKHPKRPTDFRKPSRSIKNKACFVSWMLIFYMWDVLVELSCHLSTSQCISNTWSMHSQQPWCFFVFEWPDCDNSLIINYFSGCFYLLYIFGFASFRAIIEVFSRIISYFLFLLWLADDLFFH